MTRFGERRILGFGCRSAGLPDRFYQEEDGVGNT